jgi:hypothetical protein
MSQNPNDQREMTAEEQNRQQWQPMQYHQPQTPTVHYAPRLSDEDVERIARAVVRLLREKADYPR